MRITSVVLSRKVPGWSTRELRFSSSSVTARPVSISSACRSRFDDGRALVLAAYPGAGVACGDDKIGAVESCSHGDGIFKAVKEDAVRVRVDQLPHRLGAHRLQQDICVAEACPRCRPGPCPARSRSRRLVARRRRRHGSGAGSLRASVKSHSRLALSWYNKPSRVRDQRWRRVHSAQCDALVKLRRRRAGRLLDRSVDENGWTAEPTSPRICSPLARGGSRRRSRCPWQRGSLQRG